jgi:hypothetical protein
MILYDECDMIQSARDMQRENAYICPSTCVLYVLRVLNVGELGPVVVVTGFSIIITYPARI